MFVSRVQCAQARHTTCSSSTEAAIILENGGGGGEGVRGGNFPDS